jgi:methyl-accepting chemotaxis protein
MVRRADGTEMASWRFDTSVPVTVPTNPAGPAMIAHGQLHIFQEVQSKAGVRGLLVLGFSLEELDRDRERNLLVGSFVGGSVLVVGVLLSAFIAMLLARPIGQLAHATAEIVATGDLTQSVQVLASDDELGLLARSVAEIIHQQRSILERLQSLIEGITEVIVRVSRAGEAVASGTAEIQVRVAETSTATDEMMQSLRAIADDADTLQKNAEEGATSLIQMGASNNQAASNIQTLAESVKRTAGAVDQIGQSIEEIARNIEQLTTTIGETSVAMQQMDAAIEGVEGNAAETARLSERVTEHAETGAQALGKTLEGIHRIRDTVQSTAHIIETLGNRIGTIGDILSVIDDVAAQTKLLSLNAAIIAAQAGEHGRGFSVVADQIKELAQRTGVSTREISNLIHDIQSESRNAMEAMARGVGSVEEGVRIGQDATEALQRILVSADESRAMIREIARSTVDQSRGSKQITASLQRIAGSVDEVSRYTQGLASDARQVTETTRSMELLTEQVHHASDEQASGSARVIRSIEGVTGMLLRLNTAHKQQTGSAEQVLVAVKNIKEIAEEQGRSVGELERSIVSLGEEAAALDGEMSKFKV